MGVNTRNWVDLAQATDYWKALVKNLKNLLDSLAVVLVKNIIYREIMFRNYRVSINLRV